jgi:hypothetical protein
MEYYEMIYTQTTTNGKEFITISTGEGTGDVETITTTNVKDIMNDWAYITMPPQDKNIPINIY